MNRKATILIALALMAVPVLAADQPALPKGHPTIPGAAKGAPGGQQLPAGHPDMSAMQNAKATINIQLSQGTPGAAIPANLPVVVELYSRGELLRELKGTSDASGKLTFSELPLGAGFQPLVRTQYAGVKYVASAKLMDFRQPSQQIDITVYEATEQKPPLSILMRHVSVEPLSDFVRVTETINIQGGGERAWIGDAAADGKRQTLALQLPAQAQGHQVSFALDDQCSVKENNVFVISKALTPGVTSIEFVYLVPMQGEKARLTFTAPLATKQMMLFAVDAGGAISAEGLKQTAAHQMGAAKAQVFNAAELKTGEQVSLTVGKPKNAMPALPKGHPEMPKK